MRARIMMVIFTPILINVVQEQDIEVVHVPPMDGKLASFEPKI